MVDPVDGLSESVKWFSSLGVGGVIAGVLFMFYRKDVRQFTDLWRTQTEMLVEVVRENTASNTKLITLIEQGPALTARMLNVVEELSRRLEREQRLDHAERDHRRHLEDDKR